MFNDRNNISMYDYKKLNVMKKVSWLMAVIFLTFGWFSVFAQNVGIGTSSPTLAKLQINGSVGASVAMFGADKNGVTISADNPEIGFNYYFNAGSRTIKAGFASLTTNPLPTTVPLQATKTGWS
jgi:hypothetical protein